MEINLVELGQRGSNMTRRLLQAEHRWVVYDLRPEIVAALSRVGPLGTGSLQELLAKMTPPRMVWLIVLAGLLAEVSL